MTNAFHRLILTISYNEVTIDHNDSVHFLTS